MSDFVDGFWSLYIAGITIVSIIGCAVLLTMQHHKRVPGQAVGTTGHEWDEDLAEYNNALPKWWMWLFWITIVFSLLYLALYPGLGTFKGMLGWTSTGQYQAEQASADALYGPVFAKYGATDALEVKEGVKPIAEFHAARHLQLTPQQNLALDQACPIVAMVKTKGRK